MVSDVGSARYIGVCEVRPPSPPPPTWAPPHLELAQPYGDFVIPLQSTQQLSKGPWDLLLANITPF